jgi:hypothetical protein
VLVTGKSASYIGHPSIYRHRIRLLNFGDRTRTSVLQRDIWS